MIRRHTYRISLLPFLIGATAGCALTEGASEQTTTGSTSQALSRANIVACTGACAERFGGRPSARYPVYYATNSVTPSTGGPTETVVTVAFLMKCGANSEDAARAFGYDPRTTSVSGLDRLEMFEDLESLQVRLGSKIPVVMDCATSPFFQVFRRVDQSHSAAVPAYYVQLSPELLADPRQEAEEAGLKPPAAIYGLDCANPLAVLWDGWSTGQPTDVLSQLAVPINDAVLREWTQVRGLELPTIACGKSATYRTELPTTPPTNTSVVAPAANRGAELYYARASFDGVANASGAYYLVSKGLGYPIDGCGANIGSLAQALGLPEEAEIADLLPTDPKFAASNPNRQPVLRCEDARARVFESTNSPSPFRYFSFGDGDGTALVRFTCDATERFFLDGIAAPQPTQVPEESLAYLSGSGNKGRIYDVGCAKEQPTTPPPDETSKACAGASVFCDDYSKPELANSYSTQNGTWTRATKTYSVKDAVVWERARALLAGDYADFDVTLEARSLGDAGFGLSYAAQGIDDGFAVIVHPAQFQGVYLKELRPGEQDDNIQSHSLPAAAPGRTMVLRVRRVGTSVTVWLDGTEVLVGDDGGTNRHGRLGLVLSLTDNVTDSGAEFSLLRLDSATSPTTCTPQCTGPACVTCTGGQSCAPAGTCTTGSGSFTWLSGASVESESTVYDGSFAAWRGRPVDIVGTWDDATYARQTELRTIAPGGDWGGWQGAIDLAIGGIFKEEKGDSWAEAARGTYDGRWRDVLKRIRSYREGRGTTYIRFAHEFNGNWWPHLWMVADDEVGDFKAAWRRFYKLKQEVFPASKLVWCPNDGTSSGIEDIRDAYPGSDVVDVIGIDTYNQWPFVANADQFLRKWTGTYDNGAPLGPESWRQFAAAQGRPLAIGEWSSQAIAGDGGGGDSPAYVKGMHDWLQAHGGRSAGQIEYEVLFNMWDNFGIWPDTRQPKAAQTYRDLW